MKKILISLIMLICLTYIVTADCIEDWQPMYDDCLLNGTQLKYYIDINNCGTYLNLSFDNGTYVDCDYCMPDIELIEEQCVWNGSGYYTLISYEDNNYFTCCDITNDIDDCIIETYPYNITNSTFCINKTTDFLLEMDENIFFSAFVDDKVYGSIWLNTTTETFTCQSYIKTLDTIGTNNIIQINPVYTQKEKSLISLTSNSYEDREFFVTNKGMATIYFTKENIIFDGRPYLFGVECSGNITKTLLRTEKVGYVNYASMNEPITRFVWLKNNLAYVMVGFFILLVIMIIVSVFIKNSRGR